ncbi:22770_t:CDS:2, partial [Racocetra persica]
KTGFDERGYYIWARVNIAIGLSSLPVLRNLVFKPDKTITITILGMLEELNKTITTTILGTLGVPDKIITTTILDILEEPDKTITTTIL